MKPETSIINVFRNYHIYVEHYRNDIATKTVILVNGAFATTTSFTQTVRYLRDKANIVLFDLPYAGRSKEFNPGPHIVTKEDEVDILEGLIHRFRANYLMSASWGGVSSLLSLARRPQSVEKAVVASFSPVINQSMRDYMSAAKEFLLRGDTVGAANLLNSTVGRYLSALMKSHNFNYLIAGVKGNEEQLIFHINQIFEFERQQYMNQFRSIDVPVLFLNGELDEYTAPHEVRQLADYMPQAEFTVIEKGGHFLDLESRQLWKTMSNAVREFFFDVDRPEDTVYRKPVYSVRHEFAEMGQSLAFAEAGD